MKIEKLKKSHKKEIMIGGLIGVSALSVLIFATTRAKYRTAESINIAKGTINYKPYDFKIMAMYEQNSSGEYTEVSTMPSNGYVINESKSYCTKDNVNKDNNAILKTINGEHVIKNLSKSDKCYLYFDRPTSVSTILQTLNKSTRPNYQTLTENTTGTIFTQQDDDGVTYYYAGAVDNNWVKFAGFYWRIIRFNGDGTIRLIYNGTEPVQTGETTQIGKIAINGNGQYKDNSYVGYMYGTPGSDNYEATHSNTNSSTIKTMVDNWYKTNIVDTGFSAKVDTNAGFCGDRDNYTNEVGTASGGGTGATTTYYGAYTRFVPISVKNNPTPTFKCKNASDLYTVNGANKGNKALTYPVGLITADEIGYAGATWRTANQSYYLYTNQHYWTMSPFYYNEGAVAFGVYNDGTLGHSWVTSGWGIRPVINLKADTIFSSGDGTSTNPYVVV